MFFLCGPHIGGLHVCGPAFHCVPLTSVLMISLLNVVVSIVTVLNPTVVEPLIHAGRGIVLEPIAGRACHDQCRNVAPIAA